MKHFALSAMVVLFVAVSTTAFAQSTAPKSQLYAGYPDRISCKEADFSPLFNSTAGDVVQVAFASGLTFKGVVASNIVKYSNLQCVIVRSSAGDEQLLSVSRIINDDKTVSYTGRILNQKYADAYELRKDDTGNYQLTKVETDKVIQSCHQ